MKLGVDKSKKTMIAVGLAAVALFMVLRMFDFGSTSSTSAAPPRPAKQVVPANRVTRHGREGKNAPPVTTSIDPRLHLNDLNQTESTEYTGKGRNIFLAQAEDVVIEKPQHSAFTKTAEKTPPPQPPPPPPPPPIELKFFGFASSEGTKRVFLSNPNNDVFVASEGDIVNRRYKIVKINATNIEVLDVLNNNRQTIPLSTS